MNLRIKSVRPQARMIGLLALLLAFVVVGLPAHGAAARPAGGSATLNIHVAEIPTGMDIAGAYVRVLDSNGTVVTKGLADASGYFQVTVPTGSYTILGSAVGYQDSQTTADVLSGVFNKAEINMVAMLAGPHPARNTPGARSR